MVWTKALVALLLTSFILLSIFIVVESAAVPNAEQTKAVEHKGAARKVFVPESDASNFFKRRSRRSVNYYGYSERQAEQRVWRLNSERTREYHEEQRDEFESYAEEERDEQMERSREANEQIREFHYDGLYPRFHWFH